MQPDLCTLIKKFVYVCFFGLCALFPMQTGFAQNTTPSVPTQTSIQDQLNSIVQHPVFRESKVGVHVMHVESKEEIFSYNSDTSLIPASVMKAITAAAALRTLGTEYTFITEVRYTGEIREDGVLKGNVYVIGAGDPYMNGEAIWKMIRNMKNAGVKSIQGNIYFDDSLFGTSLIPGWDKEVDIANGPSYFPLRSSLNFNTNNIAIAITPGKTIGSKASISLEYPFSLVEIDNQVHTAARNATPSFSIEREVLYNTEKPEQLEKMIYHIHGRIPVGANEPWLYYRSILEPQKYFSENFLQILQESGVTHKGKVDFQTAPALTNALASHISDPLRLMIGDMNKHSRNLTAEALVLAMAAQKQQPARTEDGLQTIAEYFTSLGIARSDTVLQNGSGLSPTMRITPSQISAVLIDMIEDPVFAPEYFASMSVNGRDGTLKRRIPQNTAMFRGKTGSINGVFCVAGYVRANDGDLYTFVFLANDIQRPTSVIRDLQDQIVQVLISLG